MELSLLEWVKGVQKNKNLLSLDDEAKTKQSIILPILFKLGWNIFDALNEVCPEYRIKAKRTEDSVKKVDYSLRYQDQNRVFLEVKKVGIDLEIGDHQIQLLNYSFREGVELAILTNGISWWFYLPLRPGGWEQRRFYTIELFDQDPEEIVRKFSDFLSKDNVITGKAKENAEKLFTSNQKESLIKQNLPKAWNKIIEESNETLIDLIADTTAKLCGYKPDDEVVEKFIAQFANQKEYSNAINLTTDQSYKGKVPRSQSLQNTIYGSNVTNTQPSSYIFLGKSYRVKKWKEVLIKITINMLTLHPDQFSKVLTLSGRKPYFSKNPEELRNSEEINRTGIFIETNMSAVQKFKLSYAIIELFGYSESDLVINYQ
jgi:hypothetical protein